MSDRFAILCTLGVLALLLGGLALLQGASPLRTGGAGVGLASLVLLAHETRDRWLPLVEQLGDWLADE